MTTAEVLLSSMWLLSLVQRRRCTPIESSRPKGRGEAFDLEGSKEGRALGGFADSMGVKGGASLAAPLVTGFDFDEDVESVKGDAHGEGKPDEPRNDEVGVRNVALTPG